MLEFQIIADLVREGGCVDILLHSVDHRDRRNGS